MVIIKTKLPFLVFLLSLFLVSLAYEGEDPEQELRQCLQQCQRQQRSQEQQQCQQRCQERFREQQRQEGRGSGNPQDPQQELQQCQRRCHEQKQGQQQCQRRCQERYEQQQREHGRGGDSGNPEDPQRELQQCQRRCQQQQQGQQQCQQRCQERYEEQQREQGRRGVSGNPEEPRREYEQCQRRCREQQQGQQQCLQRCQERYEEQQREEQRGGGSGNREDPQRQYQQCKQRCQEKERGQKQQQCQRRCEEQYREQQREHGRGSGEGNPQSEGYEEEQTNNPYVFDEQRFTSRFRTQEGHIRALERFSKRSELLRGIENYRLVILEANPNTFVIPAHFDAEAVFVLLRGRGTISLVRQDNRESFNLQKGDVIRVPSGTTVYLINKDSNEKLHVAKLFKPVNTPGYYKEYYGVGGENPESFFRVFSNEILEAAFNTPNEKLQRLFGQQRKGVIIRASQEQIRALTQHVSSEGDRHGPYNLLNKRPKHSNNYGKLFEVTPNDYQELQDLDVSVAFTNISQGAMMAPFYNTRSTKVVLVDGGNGYFEMACPHLASQRQGPPQGGEEQEQEQEHEGGVHYQKVRSRLSPQTVFVIPAGHPVAIVASQNENLQLVVFGINAKDNHRNFLAGKENVMNQVEREAKELAFNIPGREIEQIFKNQGQSYFLPGPHQRQQREEGHGPLEAILDFVGF